MPARPNGAPTARTRSPISMSSLSPKARNGNASLDVEHDDGEVGLRVGANLARDELLAAGELHRDVIGAGDDVIVGDDDAIGGDKEAGAEANLSSVRRRRKRRRRRGRSDVNRRGDASRRGVAASLCRSCPARPGYDGRQHFLDDIAEAGGIARGRCGDRWSVGGSRVGEEGASELSGQPTQQEAAHDRHEALSSVGPPFALGCLSVTILRSTSAGEKGTTPGDPAWVRGRRSGLPLMRQAKRGKPSLPTAPRRRWAAGLPRFEVVGSSLKRFVDDDSRRRRSTR